VAQGETVCEINTRWTAGERRHARNTGKSDRRDALAIARYLWREGAGLPVVGGDDTSAVLAVLVAHQLLLQLDPTYKTHLPALTTPAGVAALEGYQAAGCGTLAETRAAVVRLLGQRLRLALRQADDLKVQIQTCARVAYAPLMRLSGVNALSAGMLAAILGPGRRFRTEAALALYAGVAPLEVSSAGRVRHRLNRGGNRQLNAIVYRIALTQLQHLPQAQAYVARRLSEGKSKAEAIRALKRYIVRAIWMLWEECLVTAPVQPASQVA
jgi:transposase